MIIDFHTHTFPDKIADKTIAHLAEFGGTKPYRRGTVASLIESMSEAGIDISVVLPVATAPKQVESINRLSAELNGKDGLYFAGAIHPDCENVEEILDTVKEAGLFGIKIHPDYQGVRFNDERYIKIMKEAASRGLITVTHAGIDVGYPDDVHCTPDMVLDALEKLGGIIDGKLVLAHMGGHDLEDEVFEKLCGKPVYFDTSFDLDKHTDKCVAIIEKHGADKILFATDSPWADQKKFARLIRTLPLTPDQAELICSGNAKKLLKII